MELAMCVSTWTGWWPSLLSWLITQQSTLNKAPLLIPKSSTCGCVYIYLYIYIYIYIYFYIYIFIYLTMISTIYYVYRTL